MGDKDTRRLLEHLMQWRNHIVYKTRQSTGEDLNLWNVLQDAVLKRIVAVVPLTIDELACVDGMGVFECLIICDCKMPQIYHGHL